MVSGALMGLHVFDGDLELLALLVPLVNGREKQLLVHFAAHDEEVGAQVVQLGARTVGTILNVQGQLLQVLLPQHALLQNFLLLLCCNQLPVTLFLFQIGRAHV